MTDLENIWNEDTWTQQARSLIKGLKEYSLNPKISMIIRHSQRYEPEITDRNASMELTPQGHQIARKFGEKLPRNRILRIYHSRINRCKETAEEIHMGFKACGGESYFKGECNVLFDIGFDRNSMETEWIKYYKKNEFFYRWVAGMYDPDGFPLLTPFCKKGAKVIWNNAKQTPENGLDLYVSHDWHIATYRIGWFGFPMEGIVDYLGGFAFSFEKDYIKVLDSGDIRNIEIPYWWNKFCKKILFYNYI